MLHANTHTYSMCKRAKCAYAFLAIIPPRYTAYTSKKHTLTWLHAPAVRQARRTRGLSAPVSRATVMCDASVTARGLPQTQKTTRARFALASKTHTVPEEAMSACCGSCGRITRGPVPGRIQQRSRNTSRSVLDGQAHAVKLISFSSSAEAVTRRFWAEPHKEHIKHTGVRVLSVGASGDRVGLGGMACVSTVRWCSRRCGPKFGAL